MARNTRLSASDGHGRVRSHVALSPHTRLDYHTLPLSPNLPLPLRRHPSPLSRLPASCAGPTLLMAQLLNPAAAPDPGRISQILPTVKCSNCNQPVPIHELGDHVCEPAPAMPALKSLVSPLSAIELDPQKIQSKHSFPAQKTVQSHQPVTSHTGSGPNAHVSLTGAPVGIQTRSRALSTSSRRSARTPEPGPSRHDNGASRHPFPAGPASPGPQRVRSPLTSNTPPMPAEVPFPTTRSPSISSRSPTPGRGYPPLVSSLQPPRAPSTPGPRATPPPSLFSGVRPAAHSSPAPSPYTSQPQPPVARQRTPGPPPPSQLSLPAGRSRAASSATTGGYEVIYSTGGNNNGPATASAFPPRFPSNASDHGMHPPRARMPSTSSLPPAQPPMRARAPSTSSVGPHPYSARAQTPSSPGSATGRPSFDRRPSNLANGYPLPPSTPGPPPPPTPTPAPGTVRSPVPKIDTKTGGEAGMAGVGRRGFAAAAAAALFTTAINTHEGSPGTPSPLAFPSQGMDGRRSNAPKLVDVVSATQYGMYSVWHSNNVSAHIIPNPRCYPSSIACYSFSTLAEVARFWSSIAHTAYDTDKPWPCTPRRNVARPTLIKGLVKRFPARSPCSSAPRAAQSTITCCSDHHAHHAPTTVLREVQSTTTAFGEPRTYSCCTAAFTSIRFRFRVRWLGIRQR